MHGSTPAAHAGSTTIRISQFTFDPAEQTVSVGDTVTWVNADILPHTTAADSGAWSSGELAVGAKYVFVARDTGRYAYRCAAHPSMHGMLVVRPADPLQRPPR